SARIQAAASGSNDAPAARLYQLAPQAASVSPTALLYKLDRSCQGRHAALAVSADVMQPVSDCCEWKQHHIDARPHLASMEDRGAEMRECLVRPMGRRRGRASGDGAAMLGRGLEGCRPRPALACSFPATAPSRR